MPLVTIKTSTTRTKPWTIKNHTTAIKPVKNNKNTNRNKYNNNKNNSSSISNNNNKNNNSNKNNDKNICRGVKSLLEDWILRSQLRHSGYYGKQKGNYSVDNLTPLDSMLREN